MGYQPKLQHSSYLISIHILKLPKFDMTIKIPLVLTEFGHGSNSVGKDSQISNS